jgi:AcrR family transcriptional regulator
MPRQSTTTAPKRLSQEAVVRAATKLFAVHGYRGASLDMIAAQLGVTRQAVLYYFPTKVKLLIAVLELRDREDTARFTALAEEHHWSLGDALAAVVRHNLQHPELARLYTVLAAEAVEPGHPAHDWFVARYSRLRGQLTAALADAPDSALGPEALAIALVALLDGLQLQTLLEPGVISADYPLTTILTRLKG